MHSTEVNDLQWTELKMTVKTKQRKETWYTLRGSGIYCIGASAYGSSSIKTARGLLDTNQTHQRLVLHNLTQVMTYCCPVKMNLLRELLIK